MYKTSPMPLVPLRRHNNDAEPYVPITYFLLSIRSESYPKRPLDGRCEARELRGANLQMTETLHLYAMAFSTEPPVP
jgi:hypothetical protein